MADTTLHISKGTVKRMMKLNDDVSILSADAIALTAKATEFFIQQLSRDCFFEVAMREAKILRMDDLVAAIDNNQLKYEFLSEAFSLKETNQG